MARRRGLCFVIMPFRDKFEPVLRAIRKTAASCGLDCIRADESTRAGSVMLAIQEHIEDASVVISDLTGRNANVFYETAIAHTKKDPHQVILLAQQNKDVPFDLRALRYLRYRTTRTGLLTLRTQLRGFIREGLAGSTGPLFETINGKEERTRRLVAETRALLEGIPGSLKGFTLRFEAGLSCLSLNEHELKDSPPQELPYRRLLLQERDGILELLRHGARIKAILVPRIHPLHVRRADAKKRSPMPGARLLYRYDSLIERLQSRRELPPGDCEVALLDPGYTRNVYIFGDKVLYEGIKAGLAGGFDLTTRMTDKRQVSARMEAFDSLFGDAVFQTLQRWGQGTGSRKRDLRDAVLAGLSEGFRRFGEIWEAAGGKIPRDLKNYP